MNDSQIAFPNDANRKEEFCLHLSKPSITINFCQKEHDKNDYKAVRHWVYRNRCHGKKHGKKLAKGRIPSSCLYPYERKSSRINRTWSGMEKFRSGTGGIV